MSNRRPAPWFENSSFKPPQNKTAVVIGAGLAGTGVTESLVRRGFTVTLIDRAHKAAEGASSNPAGVIYPQVSIEETTNSRLSRAGLEYLIEKVTRLQRQGAQVIYDLCGVLELAADEAEALHSRRVIEASLTKNLSYLDAKETSREAGIDIQCPALLIPRAGWLDPRSLCEANILVSQQGCRTLFETSVLELRQLDHGWVVVAADKQSSKREVARADVVVIASGPDAKNFIQTSWMELYSVRGQIDFFEAPDATPTPCRVLNYEGYITPSLAHEAGHLLAGATFDWKSQEASPRLSDREFITSALHKKLPALAHLKPTGRSRVGFRATTPDSVPVLGPVPDIAFFNEAYAELWRGRAVETYAQGRYLPGLYVATGFGTRGVTYSQICADIVAAQAAGETPQIDAELLPHLLLARYLVRRLKRKNST